MKKGVTKAEFVKKLEELLCATRLGIDRLELQDDDSGTYVMVKLDDSYTKVIDITGDSGIAIIRDVAARL